MALPGSVTITAGNTQASISVNVVDNNILESDENLVLTLNTVSSGDADISIDNANSSATVTILDDDSASVGVTANDPAAAEPNNNGQFTVSLSQASDSDTVIAYTLSGSATSGEDYVALPGSVTITAGNTQASISVDVVDNNILESDETLVLTLNTVSSGDADISIDNANSSATVTILDDDSASVGVTANDPAAAEPNNNGQFTVSLSQASDSDTVIAYTLSGTATSGEDYVALPGSVTITAGNTQASISVDVVDNNILESDETLVLTLNTVSSGDADISIDNANSSATVTILDDDSASVGVTANDPAAAEPNNNGQFTVSLSQASDSDTVIAYTLSGSATSGEDYVALPGSVTITAGNTQASISVDVVDNNILESDETLVLTLNTVSSGDADISIDNANSSATVTILDDDSASVGVTANDPAAAEPNNNGQFTVSLSQASDSDTVIAYTLSGTATW